MVVSASVVVLRAPDKTAPSRRMGVQVSVLPLATSYALYRTAANRGRTSSLQMLRLLLVALVLFPTLPPTPSALGGQPAPTPDATLCRSSHSSARGDLQTMYTMLGQELGRVVQQNTKFTKVPCEKVPSTANHRYPRTFQDKCSTTPHGSALSRCDPNRRPYTTDRLLFTQSNKGDNPTRGPVHDSPFSTQ